MGFDSAATEVEVVLAAGCEGGALAYFSDRWGIFIHLCRFVEGLYCEVSAAVKILSLFGTAGYDV